MYERGEGVKQDTNEAARLKRLARGWLEGEEVKVLAVGGLAVARYYGGIWVIIAHVLVMLTCWHGLAICAAVQLLPLLPAFISQAWAVCCTKIRKYKRDRAARKLQELVVLENAGRQQRRQEEEQRQIQLQLLERQEAAAQLEQRQERLQQQQAEQRQRSQEAKHRKRTAKAQKEQATRELRTAEERAVFWIWADKWGCDSWERFVDASVSDIMELKMSSNELEVVLQGLAIDEPTSWAKFKSVEGQKFMRRLEKMLEDGSSSGVTDTETASVGVSDSDADSHVCVICMAAAVTVVLVHSNETSHRCVCVECSDRLKAQVPPGACPVCRAPIVVHLKNVFGGGSER
jgi:hypothetical protein